MAFSIPIFLLVLVGVLLIAPIRKGNGDKRINIAKSVRATKRARIITDRTPLFIRFRDSMLLSIEQAGVRLTWEGYLSFCVASSVLGALAGAVTENIPLSVVLAALLPVVVTQYIKIRSLGYRSFVYMQIEDSLSIITSTYIQCEDIRSALDSCLDRVEPPLKDILADCANQIYTGVHAADAIRRMSARVDNRSWREWCDTVIQCQADRSRMVLLPPIVQQLSAIRQTQAELDTQTSNIWRDHIIMCLMAITAVPFIGFLNADWFTYLTTTIWGKLAIAVAYAIVGISTLVVARINKPLSMEV